MRFCQDHWNKLKDAVKCQGMWGMVATSGEEACDRTVSQIEDGPQPGNFDPLMEIHWMIAGRVIEQNGAYLLTGDYCPMCEAGKHCDECRAIVETWPESAAKHVKAEYDKRRGGQA